MCRHFIFQFWTERFLFVVFLKFTLYFNSFYKTVNDYVGELKTLLDNTRAETEQENKTEELPDSWWYRVYLAVIIFTIFVIAALWAFSYYFSK
mgnify:CR=1 FL=1